MPTPVRASSRLRAGQIEVDLRCGEVRRNGEKIRLQQRPFKILAALLQHPGEVVTREELRQTLWPNDTFVDFEHGINTGVKKLREALGDNAESPQFIETLPTYGYRFIPPVEPLETNGALPEAETPAPPDTSAGNVEDRNPNATNRSRSLLIAVAAAILLAVAAGFIPKRFIGTTSTRVSERALPAMEQRLTANPSDVPVKTAIISPDGKYLAYADSTGLYLREVSSGETHHLILPKDFVAWPWSWFPDGTHLLVVRIAGQPADFNLWKPSLYKLSILGGEPQELVDKARSGYVSPDGSRIAYLAPKPSMNEIWIANSEGANPRRIVSTGDTNQSWIYPVAWSPTGQHLAYVEAHSVAGPDPVGPVRTLHIIAPDGTGQAMVLADPRIGAALWWAPDGRILFSYREDPASRQDNFGVYSIRIDERSGKANGPPQPITKAEGRIGGMSGTEDGKRLVIWRNSASSQVFLSRYDAATRQWKEPRRLIVDATGNLASAWTADSKAVLLVSNRNGTWKLFKQAIDETTPEVLAEGTSISVPRLSADGSQVLYLSSPNPDDVSFPVSLMSKPLAGGPPRVIIQGKGIYNHQCATAPATLCIFSQFDGQSHIFRTFDLQHGAGRELLRMMVGGPLNWSLSSDGSKLAIFFFASHRIRFFSVATGAAHDVTVKDWVLYSGDWGASGKTVFMQSRLPTGVPVILEVDQAGTAKVVLEGRANTEWDWMIQSPDSRYAVIGEYIPSDNNAWMVDHF